MVIYIYVIQLYNAWKSHNIGFRQLNVNLLCIFVCHMATRYDFLIASWGNESDLMQLAPGLTQIS